MSVGSPEFGKFKSGMGTLSKGYSIASISYLNGRISGNSNYSNNLEYSNELTLYNGGENDCGDQSSSGANHLN